MTAENEDLKAKLAAAERRIAELSRGEAAAAAPAFEPVVAAPAEPEPAAAPEPEPPAAEPEPVAAPAPAYAAPAPAAGRLSEPESATGMLQLAQKLHDDYVRAGQEEGERIISEARAQAERIVAEAEETSSRTLAALEQERS